jgi:hypothetical protein
MTMAVGRVERMRHDGSVMTVYLKGEKVPDTEPAPPVAKIIAISLPDMPQHVLDGRLGELASKRLAGLPLAYSWPSMLAAASVKARAENLQTNLYAGTVGDVHTGKSVARARAIHALGLKGSECVLDSFTGSGEGLIQEVRNAGSEPRLLSPDELGHLLSKMAIEHSSFPFLLNRAFYETGFRVRMGRGQEGYFNATLSILGGIVTDAFEELFGHATIQGFWDRFLFGLCPSGFVYDYHPIDFEPQKIATSSVYVDGSVWEAKSDWLRETKDLNPRLAEIVIRCAAICASFDGRQTLSAQDLGPAHELLLYETRVRQFLTPNPGRTLDGEMAFKILAYLKRATPGDWVNRRKMYSEINAYRIGPAVADRTVKALQFAGDIETLIVGKQTLVRLTPEEPLSTHFAGESTQQSGSEKP